MEPIKTITSKAIMLMVNNIDTDQIIPARFLKVTDKNGLGANLFSDWRYMEDGTPKPDFLLNRPESQGAQILITGDNFGCGSSREHAPWALMGYGIKAVVSTSFADIFRNNALKNGLLPIQINQAQHQELVETIQQNPNSVLVIDLETQTLELGPAKCYAFSIDSFSQTCLLNGVDELGYLLKLDEKITAFEMKM
jgi:3-isopropylmalate/(R)-2-methylmalate dehydratase small subunit